jgi:hypothetical protein
MLDTLRRDVPPAAFSLGLLGAGPFVGLAVMTLTGDGLGIWAGLALLAYGAVILSFMGGVHWGWAMAAGEPSLERLGLSVVPSLVGWGGFLLGGSAGLIVLALGFIGLLWLDLRAVAAGRAATWYPQLRWPLTVIVVASLVLAALAG